LAIVDFHNHLMPGVDDGAQSHGECLDGLQAFRKSGVESIVATPHLDGSLTIKREPLAERLEELDNGWATLQQCGRETGMQVRRGVELLLDTPEPDLSDPRVRLDGGNFVLMEFPYMVVPPQSARAVRFISDAGYRPIIAHPERYRGFAMQVEQAAAWKESGGLLQVNGGSLLGRYGAEARRAAFELLERGWVDYICSDFHARGPVLVADYRALLESQEAAEQAHTLMETNPSRMLEGLTPLPVAPMRAKRAGLWDRVTAMFKAQ